MLFRGQGKGLAVIAVLLGLNASMSISAKAGEALYASLGETARSPIGWGEFCAENPGDCRGGTSQPRDIVMSQTAWRELLRAHKKANRTLHAVTGNNHLGGRRKWQ